MAQLPTKTKKNPWFKVAPNLGTDENGVGYYLNNDVKIPFQVKDYGNCKAKTVTNGKLS